MGKAKKVYGLYTLEDELPVLIGMSTEIAKYLGIPAQNISSYAKKGNKVLKKWRIHEIT